MEIQEKYDGCPACGFGKCLVRWFPERTAGWLRKARPEYIRVTCTACDHVTHVKRGGMGSVS
jgi:hypothetical protein